MQEIKGLSIFYIMLCVLKCVLYQRRDDGGENWAAGLKTRVGVDLNQPDIV